LNCCELGADTKDIQRFQQIDVIRLCPRNSFHEAAALQPNCSLLTGHRPNNWMICEPSVWPTFISPIVLTRQLLQPSVNSWTNQQINFGFGVIDAGESDSENGRSDTFSCSGAGRTGRGVWRVADIDEPRVRCFRRDAAQFRRRAVSGQRACGDGGALKTFFQDVGEKFGRRQATFNQNG